MDAVGSSGAVGRASAAAVAVVIAIVSQRWLSDGHTLRATIGYVLAIVVFVGATNDVSRRIMSGATIGAAPIDGRGLFTGWWLLAILGAGITAILYDAREPTGWHWILWLLTIALALFATWRSDQRFGTSAGPDDRDSNDVLGEVSAGNADLMTRLKASSGAVALGLVAIVVIALFLRVNDLGSIPFGFWFDEAESGLQGRQIRQDGDYRPMYIAGTFRAPATYAYMVAATTAVFGDDMAGVRMASALMGTACVVGVYFVARRWWGSTVGLAAALLLACSEWHLTISRVGMLNVALPLFSIAALAFLLRGARRGRQTDYALAGMSAAIGMTFYSALAASLIAIGVLTLFATLRTRTFRAAAPGFVVVVLGALIFLVPVLKFAAIEGGEFFARSRDTSLFSDAAGPDGGAAFSENIRSYLKMFHVVGDPNGRHNTSGEPMLSTIVGPLAMLGFGVAVRWLRRPLGLGLILWVLLGLIPGALTLPFEAPNTLRAVGSLLPAYLLAVVPLAILARSWWPLKDRIALPAMAVLVLFVGVTVFLDASGYFDRHQTNARVWSEHSTRETLTARLVNDAGTEGPSIWIVNQLRGSPTMDYLTDYRNDFTWFRSDDLLPFAIDTDRDALIITTPDTEALVQQIVATYPNAEVTTFQLNDSHSPHLLSVIVPAGDLAAIQGLDRTIGGETKRVTSVVESVSQPTEWRGGLVVTTGGIHGLRVTGAPFAKLVIDGNADSTCNSNDGERLVELNEGLHTLRLNADPGVDLALEWKPPGEDWHVIPTKHLASPDFSERGLASRLFPGGELNGPSRFDRIDPSVDFRFHELRSARPYGVEWSGTLIAEESGRYLLWISSDDVATLSIDGEEVAVVPLEGGEAEAALELEAGEYAIRATYVDSQAYSLMRVLWLPPGASRRVPIPSSALRPEAPDVAEGMQLPTMVFDRNETETSSATVESIAGVAARTDLVVAVGPDNLVVFDRDASEPRSLETQSPLPVDVELISDDVALVLDESGAIERIELSSGESAFLDTEEFRYARGLGLGSDGTVLVAHTPAQSVYALELTDPPTVTQVWETTNGQPTDAVGGPDDLSVVDVGMGTVTRERGPGESPDCMAAPREVSTGGPHVAFDDDGDLWVTSPQASTITEYRPDSATIWTFVGGGRPSGIAVTGGRVYFSDLAASELRYFDTP